MKENKSRIFIWVAMLFAIGVIVYGIWHMIDLNRDYKKADQEYAALQEMAVVENPTDEGPLEMTSDEEKVLPVPPVTVDVAGLIRENPDTVGWIYYPVVGINYPVMQDDDNTFYIRRTFQGEKNTAGCIFLNCAASPDLSDDNSFIYGHNMRNGSMFGHLKDIREGEIVQKNPYIWIFLEHTACRYQIFSWHEAGVNDASFDMDFATEQEKQEYLTEILALSEEDTGVNVDVEDRIITLSTCTSDSSVRFLVHAVLTDEVPIS